MKIYCLTCSEYILDTTDKFILGSIPYAGEMFKCASTDSHNVIDTDLRSWGQSGNILCPRCEGKFIVNNVLSTEHGLIDLGQKELNEGVCVIYLDGPFENMLMGRPGRNRDLCTLEELDKLDDPVEEATEVPRETFDNLESFPSLKVNTPVKDSVSTKKRYVCKKCDKGYERKKMFNKHKRKCGK